MDGATVQPTGVVPQATFAPEAHVASTLAARRRSYGPNTSLSYEQPLMIVRGVGTYLYDDRGKSYLDCVNNVTHVGHGNAEVAAAISSQLHTLNTNSRYLHPALPVYSETLLRTLNYQQQDQADGKIGGVCSSCRGGDCSTTTAQPSPSGGGCGCSSGGTPTTSASKPTTRQQQPLHPSQPNTRPQCQPPGASSSGCGHSTGGSQPAPSAASHPQPHPQPQPHPHPQPQPGPSLEVLYLVCSGSEANDLALRIVAAARPHARHVAVMGGAYHGHLSSLIPLSPYKFWGPGGAGRQPYVHVVPCPDPYRGENLDGRGAALAVLEAARRAGGQLGAFFCESVLSCGGQVVLPPGYLQSMYEVFRSEGVVLVADEVQCGFGRCGSAFWGFQTQGLRPDIVTMGKPIGNGYPMAALATSRELARAFAAPGMEYFNTYGGSTAAVAAGLAVLRILQRDNLQQHALRVGEHLLTGLRRLQAQHEVVGDVRGLGLFLGLEVVRDKASKRHAPVTARWIKERMKARRVLLSTDGPYDNVVKVKPPMVFGFAEADHLIAQLSDVLATELTPEVRRDLERREDEHWAAVVAPRQLIYAENRQQLMLPGVTGQGQRARL